MPPKFQFPAELNPLMKDPQWAIVKLSGTKKLPYQARDPNAHALVDDLSTWDSFEYARYRARAVEADGLGYCLLESGFGIIDLDDCRNPKTGEVDLWAQELVERADSYCEISTSGTGLHIIGFAKGAPVQAKKAEGQGSVELYRDCARYVWITGNTFLKRPLAYIDTIIDEVSRQAKPVARPKRSPKVTRSALGLPRWVQKIIAEGVPEGRRSVEFFRVVAFLEEKGWTRDEILAEFKRHPNGIAEKYQGRLETEVERAFEKAESRATGAGPTRRFATKSLAEVVEEKVDWLWYPYLGRGEVTILEGDPEIGKSFIAQIVSAAICDGSTLPSSDPKHHEPGKVLYFDVENSAAHVTKPRLRQLKNKHNFFQEETAFTIGTETKALDEAIRRIRPDLIVFDTINTYLSDKGQSQYAAQVTQDMLKFREIARTYDCAVLVLRHLTKSARDKAMYRGQGSIAFTGIARIVITCGRHPDDGDRRVMAVTKINIAPRPPALSYTIKNDPALKSAPIFAWGDFVDLTSEDVVGGERKGRGRPRSEGDLAAERLREWLAPGPMEKSRLEHMARPLSISPSTLQRAAQYIGVVKRKKNKTSIWSLPDHGS